MNTDYLTKLDSMVESRFVTVEVPARVWAPLMDVVRASSALESEMTNPVPCHVMRRQHLGALTAALAKLAAAVEGGGSK